MKLSFFGILSYVDYGDEVHGKEVDREHGDDGDEHLGHLAPSLELVVQRAVGATAAGASRRRLLVVVVRVGVGVGGAVVAAATAGVVGVVAGCGGVAVAVGVLPAAAAVARGGESVQPEHGHVGVGVIGVVTGA